MPTLTLTDDQAIGLIKQLPPDQQAVLLRYLLTHHWGAWVELSRAGDARVRAAAAQRGHAWDTMTEDERDAFVNDLIHEGR